jgi:prepilin-type N-terminal cleavage/methylation domain-containing protein
MKSERGFSLVELSIVMAVAGVVLSAAWVAGNAMKEEARVKATIENERILVQNVRSFFVGRAGVQASGSALSSACFSSCMVRKNLVPRDLIRTVSTDDSDCAGGGSCVGKMDHPWQSSLQATNGGIVLAVASATAQEFTVEFTKLPQKACANLSMKLGDPTAVSGLKSLSINGAAQNHSTQTLNGYLAACGAGDNAKIDVVYRLRGAGMDGQ